MKTNWTRVLALALALVWSGNWAFFAIASVCGDALGWQKALPPALLGALIFLGSAFAGWRFTLAGAVLLLVEGGLVCAGYATGFLKETGPGIRNFVLLTLAAPPMVSGLLLLLGWRRAQAPKPA